MLKRSLMALALLAACSPTAFVPTKTLTKGAQVPLAEVLRANAGKYMCFDYEAATDSCASLSRASLSGKTITAQETAAVQSPQGPVILNLTTTSRLEGDRACLNGSDMRLSSNSGSVGMENFVLGITQSVVDDFGGVCATYYQADNGYVVTTKGRNGKTFPPGDSSVIFFDAPKSVRSQ